MGELFGVLMVDDAGHTDARIIAANRMIHELLGYDEGELIGERLNALIPPRSRVAHRHLREEYMKDPQTRPMGPDREVYIRHKDGSESRIWVGLDPQKNNLISVVVLDVEDFAGNHVPLNPPEEP